jgi:XTP/dITP diphosphohydrolase
MKLVLASRNPHKLREWRSALPEWEIEALEPAQEPVEDGASFEENARIKAWHGRAYAEGEDWVVGEDAGIEVAALGGRPGIESARWAAEPVVRLLAELHGVEERGARYVCEVVAVGGHRSELRASGALDGEIVRAPRGNEGFGYDPIFVPDGESHTVAELGDAWKAEHSHRAKAARALAELLGSTRLDTGT